MTRRFISVARDRSHVRITRIADGVVMYDGTSQGAFTPVRPEGIERAGGTVHAEWLALSFEERSAIVAEIGADPTRRPPRRTAAPVAPDREIVGEMVGRLLVLRERPKRR